MIFRLLDNGVEIVGGNPTFVYVLNIYKDSMQESFSYRRGRVCKQCGVAITMLRNLKDKNLWIACDSKSTVNAYEYFDYSKTYLKPHQCIPPQNPSSFKLKDKAVNYLLQKRKLLL
jgi:hypothetical protein